MKRHSKFSLIFLLCINSFYADAQYYKVQLYGGMIGLMSNNIKGIGQDELGRIWVADGQGFDIIDGSIIRSMRGDQNYFQWGSSFRIVFKNNKIYSNQGVIFDRTLKKFSMDRYAVSGAESDAYWPGISYNGRSVAPPDGNGNYWSFNKYEEPPYIKSIWKNGLYKSDGKNKIKFGSEQGLCDDSLILLSEYVMKPVIQWIYYTFIIDNRGDTWVRSKKGLYRYSNEKQKFEFSNIKLENVSIC